MDLILFWSQRSRSHSLFADDAYLHLACDSDLLYPIKKIPPDSEFLRILITNARWFSSFFCKCGSGPVRGAPSLAYGLQSDI